ncbi:alpha-glucosidase [Tessaracoccus sp. OS52]|uniref:alpha-glucosidase n=1 Tax=Tessaracoccus sp. OS52 TaxID=2886691 RepID=UPI001D10B0BE|nr:alpha-glucosidase [Tessaracoccus sp. OS52]MCC2594160.1 alpha-glucosidase [Tessaracoccus sp. OS52]
MPTHITHHSTVGDAYAHPVGRDALDRIMLGLGLSRAWVDNPAVRALPLKLLGRIGLGHDLTDSLVALLNDTHDHPSYRSGAITPKWWKKAVFYQVYPRSFADSNGDGMGDVRGIIEHLDHFVELGVDCLWLSPIFESPDADNGYDISDYRAVMEQMGTLEDVDELIAGCHERGMRIIFDLVVNHTSDEHEWFKRAVSEPDGPTGDYYFFRDGDPDTPPNNWVSFFSGPAWRWVEERQQWVLHLFGQQQIDLNWENQDVRDEVAAVVRWWMDRGVDGFRLDVINYISKRPGLPDGSEFVGKLLEFYGIEHYFHGPKLHEYLAELRRNGFVRPDADPDDVGPGRDAVGVMIGETPGIGVEMGRLLTGEDRHELDMIFNFDHLDGPGKTRWDDYRYDLNHLKRHYIDYQSRIGSGDWMSIFWDNHDNPRMLSKVNPDPQYRTQLAKALATIQMLMRGTPFMYQGQEIAAINQNFPDATHLRDLESINRIAEQELLGRDGLSAVLPGSRDHTRTPMRWDATEKHGFTTGEPWIGFHETSEGYTVAEQRQDPDSVLNYYRWLIALRRQYPALTIGDIHFIARRRRNYFAWYREIDAAAGEPDRWFIEVNLLEYPTVRPRRVPGAHRVLGPYEVKILHAPRGHRHHHRYRHRR